MPSRTVIRFVFLLAILVTATVAFAQSARIECAESARIEHAESARIECVERLRTALEREGYELARTFLTEYPRVWYDGREGEGFPWTLGGGRWKKWDHHFNGVSEPQVPPPGRRRQGVGRFFYEINDYFRLTGRSGGYFRKTWFFEGDKIEGYMISAVPDARAATKGRFDEFEGWARQHALEELDYLLPGGRIDPTGDRPERFRALLERWRETIGEPLGD